MKKENAYMTVEAAMIFPVVTGAIFFVIYMLLFQYDRCLLEQDTGAMALWGSLVQAPDTEMLEAKVQERVAGVYKEKYMMWRFTAMDASLDKNKFSAKGAGSVFFPFGGLNFWGGGNVWSAQAAHSYSRLAPVTFIRTCHKFQKALER
ncbi:MAG TPA: hypothetical protein DCZ91_21625 [Lachnospiraceae bacterium]|nr:hypothetical protein [Lachnospiraceae bacterium]